MARSARHPLLRGFTVTGLGVLVSRVLGLVRDMATAALLGLSGGAMDALTVAFRIPNTFRRLFGEGALSVSFLPVLAAELHRDREAAWRLASAVLTYLAAALTGLVVIGELICGGVALAHADQPATVLLAGLTAVLLPYVLLVCLAAQLATVLHALGYFAVPALMPALLNLIWLVAAVVVAPAVSDSAAGQARVIAVAIVLAGALQLAIQWIALRRAGFRFAFRPHESRAPVRRVLATMLPMMLGLAITQINTLMDSVIAWSLAPSPGGSTTIPWLPGVEYPLQIGAASTIYLGERLYQLPIGLVGVAVATAVAPLLARHAAAGDHHRLGDDLTLGLRLAAVWALPAATGLVLLAAPVAQVLFERGEFTADDSARTARVIAAYGLGVWAYCALPVIVRAYYALGRNTTPVKIGAAAVALNLALNLTLVWPLAEVGLAVSTATSAALQLALLAWRLPAECRVRWAWLTGTIGRALLASAALGGMCLALDAWLPTGEQTGQQLLRCAALVGGGGLAYFAALAVAGREELRLLLGRTGSEWSGVDSSG